MSTDFARVISWHCHARWRGAMIVALLVAVAAAPVRSLAAEPVETVPVAQQDDDEEPVEPPAGLRAEYSDTAGHRMVRVEQALNFQGSHAAVDPRLAPGEFRARWSGTLLVIAPGQHRFHLHAGGGSVRLSIAGKLLVEQVVAEPQWLDSPPVELEYGHHPLLIEFHRNREDATLGLYWSGPKFQLEHVPERALFHPAEPAIDERFERGRQLVHGLRCAACHQLFDAQPVPAAPSLANLDGNIARAWLMDWIGGHKESHSAPTNIETAPVAVAPTTELAAPSTAPRSSIDDVKFRMPGLGLNRADARHIVAYLLKETGKPAVDAGAREKAAKPEAVPDVPAAAASAGDTLFHSVGCLACHARGELGSRRLSGGGDLTTVADKRPPDFFTRWLREPQKINARHRMPVFRLDDEERENLAAYLKTLRDASRAGSTQPDKADFGGSPEQGRKLVATHHCGVCHELPASESHPANFAITLRPAKLADSDNCLGEPDPEHARPGYRLRPEQRAAVIAYLAGLSSSSHGKQAKITLNDHDIARDGARLFADLNCLGCHSRGLSLGIAAQSAAVAASNPELAGALAALAPPALTDVGDKLERTALLEAMGTAAEPRRPWLAIRMPRFQFAPGEAEALADWLIAADRIPPRADGKRGDGGLSSKFAADALHAAGSRLVTSDGFGCASCHAIGKWSPKQDNLAARGTDLSLVGQRIRRSWFDRWVHNPARIVPRMEMPAIEIPVGGVLDDRLDEQLNAVWDVLNRPGFTPPAGGAVRIVRRRNLPEEPESAALLTDVLRVEGRTMIRPLVIGLANRHNVLFDLEQNRFTGWWLGDVARESTAGKRWFWEPGGTQLLAMAKKGGTSELTLDREGNRIGPLVIGQCAAQLDSWWHVPQGIAFDTRLSFPSDADAAAVVLRVTQSITALPADATGKSGIRRRIEIHDVPQGPTVYWRLLPENPFGPSEETSSSTAARTAQPVAVNVVTPANAQLVGDHHGLAVKLIAVADQSVVCEVEYRSAVEADRFPAPAVAPAPRPAAKLHSIPGFDAVRLPLPTTEMPTGFSWQSDGTLLFTSLKGQVFAAVDSDGDKLPETLRAISDDLAAPYGLHAHDDVIDVINKNGLLRLSDFNTLGQAQRTEIVADGWGHTDDYHDWAVGPVPDGADGYFIALPCRQNARDEAAARLRGWALRLTPREPTADNPRCYTLEPFCSGLRFPMGLARTRGGELFATDNQGNYNPFNELNQLVAGAHYGFLNKFEAKDATAPPRRDPAIEIPHPWTRSVNGICFLTTPSSSEKPEAATQFGPWTGHLVGCEYDTRRLVRMSLEHVGDQFQGAVYPMSVEPAEGEEALEGPVTCQVGPDGALYIGSMRDSGWGAGQNTGSIVQLKYNGRLPAGIAEVRAAADGFEIEFAQPLPRGAGTNPANYSIESFRRVATSDYGGPDVDRQKETIRDVTLDAEGRIARLTLARMRPGHVYEIHVKNLGNGGQVFFPAEAYYTLRAVPRLSLRETGS